MNKKVISWILIVVLALAVQSVGSVSYTHLRVL